jgi:hypothetical protein
MIAISAMRLAFLLLKSDCSLPHCLKIKAQPVHHQLRFTKSRTNLFNDYKFACSSGGFAVGIKALQTVEV